MADLRVEKLAEVIVDYSIEVKSGDKVAIQGSTEAAPLIAAVYARTLQKGGHPLVQAALPGLDELFFKYAGDAQIAWVPPTAELVMETFQGRVSLVAETNTKALSNVEPAKLVASQRARTRLTETFMRRSAAKELKWVVAPYPTNALAQDAEMGLLDYEDFVYGACVPEMGDPAGYWKRFSARQQRIVDWMKGKSTVRIQAPGTDLRLSVAGRPFENCDGHFNLPDGEIYTGPVEDSAEGQVTFSYPTIYGGREVAGVRLWFEKGRVVKAAAEKNEEFLLKTLDTDEGARGLGEFAIGTNEAIQRFTREILFDEKIGGSFHLALGAGYPETGSQAHSAIHWDMVCDLRRGGQIEFDGQVIYRDGQFLPIFG
jgi:aminopeptidase